jgi:hypothetical protein
MFEFAMFIGMIRKIVRPGVIWFIRDTEEEEFNPIREMIDRPIGVQLEKISMSMMIYATILTFAFGAISYGIVIGQWTLRVLWTRIVQGEHNMSFANLTDTPLFLPLAFEGDGALDAHVQFLLDQFVRYGFMSDIDVQVFAVFARFIQPRAFYRGLWRIVVSRFASMWRLKSFFFGRN